MRKIVSATLVLFLVMPVGVSASDIVVYYIPFYVQTYLPITPNAIECSAEETWHFDSNSDQGRKLLRFAERVPGKVLQESVIRVKIKSPTKTFLVDINGNARDEAGESFFFSPVLVSIFRERLLPEMIRKEAKADCER